MALSSTSSEALSELRSRSNLALERLQETRSLEFKRGLSWQEIRPQIAKAALAMSNNRDGGLIVIGVEENDDWELAGVAESTLESYDQDDIASYLQKFSSPPIDVTAARHEYANQVFVVLDISPFQETPVVAKADSPENGKYFRRGDFLVRPYGKVESARVVDETQMHDLLEVAAEKRARRFLRTAENIGMVLPPSHEQAFREEREKLANHGLDFTSCPTWEFNIRGTVYDAENLDSVSRCVEIIERSSVLLRGWDFPHIPRSHNELIPGPDFIAHGVEFGCREFWQFWRSGQFYFIEGLREVVDDNWREQIERTNPLKNVAVSSGAESINGYFMLISELYRFVELYEFAARLSETGIYKEGFIVQVRLRHASGYMVATDFSRRLRYAYTAKQDDLSREWTYTPEDVVVSVKACAQKAYIEVMRSFFGWFNLPADAFDEDIDEFLANRRR